MRVLRHRRKATSPKANTVIHHHTVFSHTDLAAHRHIIRNIRMRSVHREISRWEEVHQEPVTKIQMQLNRCAPNNKHPWCHKNPTMLPRLLLERLSIVLPHRRRRLGRTIGAQRMMCLSIRSPKYRTLSQLPTWTTIWTCWKLVIIVEMLNTTQSDSPP